MSNKPCPCDSTLNYAVCCGRFHKGNIKAPTAEALMRSRYTAYVMGNAHYLYKTWHEKTRPSLASLKESGAQKLIALKIVTTQAGGENDLKGMVEFIASSESTNPEEPIYQHHEKSLFIKVKQQWLYIDRI